MSSKKGYHPAGAGIERALARREGSDSSSLARTECGVQPVGMDLSCRRSAQHTGLHRAFGYAWASGGRPHHTDDPLPHDHAEGGPSAEQRLAELTQVLLTARAKMLGLGEGLRGALSSMPRAVDRQAVAGLVGALGEIVQLLDRHSVQPGETGLTGMVKLSADRGIQAHFQVPGLVARGSGPRREPDIVFEASDHDVVEAYEDPRCAGCGQYIGHSCPTGGRCLPTGKR